MRQGDLLLVQYPYFPVKGYGVARLALHLLRWKGVKTPARTTPTRSGGLGEAPRAGATSCRCRGSRRSSCTGSGWKATCAQWA